MQNTLGNLAATLKMLADNLNVLREQRVDTLRSLTELRALHDKNLELIGPLGAVKLAIDSTEDRMSTLSRMIEAFECELAEYEQVAAQTAPQSHVQDDIMSAAADADPISPAARDAWVKQLEAEIKRLENSSPLFFQHHTEVGADILEFHAKTGDSRTERLLEKLHEAGMSLLIQGCNTDPRPALKHVRGLMDVLHKRKTAGPERGRSLPSAVSTNRGQNPSVLTLDLESCALSTLIDSAPSQALCDDAPRIALEVIAMDKKYKWAQIKSPAVNMMVRLCNRVISAGIVTMGDLNWVRSIIGSLNEL